MSFLIAGGAVASIAGGLFGMGSAKRARRAACSVDQARHYKLQKRN